MNAQTDQQLLRDYAGNRSEAAFDELVRRHIDLVYSAALRMVCDSHQAEDVTQGVFLALAQNARQLTHHPVLSGWLHRTTQNLAANAVRTNVRRRAREQEAAAMNELLATAPDQGWEHIAPHLDAALGELSEPDRDALLLRYFEKKSAREMAQQLGISDEAAQKRVSRAVERLREFFAKRGVTVGASGLVVVISANAVQAAPVGLAITISTAAALAGTTLATATTAINAIAMTTLQNTFIVAAIAVAVGTGIYEARQASHARARSELLRQQAALQAEQSRQWQRERDEAAHQLAVMNEELARLKSRDSAVELLKLRGEVGVLRQQLALAESKIGFPATDLGTMLGDPAMREYIHQNMLLLVRLNHAPLFKELKLTPEQTEKVIQLLGDTMFKNADRMYSRPKGSVRPEEVAQTAAAGKAELEKQLLPLLGESGLARLWEFRDEMPAHATVDLLNAQLGANQLSNEENDRLFRIVKTEPFDLTRGISGDWDKAFWGSQEDIDDHLLKVAESNRRILQQAGSFLTANQLAALEAVLSNGITARITQAAALIQKP